MLLDLISNFLFTFSHCVFVSNCIGIRNHKSFYFFIVSSVLLTFNFTYTSIIHIILVLKDGLYDNLLQDKVLILVFISLILLSLPLYNVLQSKFLALTPSFIGIIGIFILFNKNMETDLPFYVNGISVLFIYLSIILFIVSLLFLLPQTYLISNGLTTKELHSIEIFNKEVKEKSEDLEALEASKSKQVIKILSFNEKINNLWKFLVLRIPNSLL